ncbi:MAG: polyprenyl synthetase family protein [Pseudomonadales bacterium]|nr:polyprenyl synthetase family protein [Pseudomonadales bacterium]MCP5213580.1 polyprenyl synthetase family protein [Pseudomonadales bacterium]
MDSKPIFSMVAADFEAVNQLILGQLHSDVQLVETISQYLVDGGGKRIRPLLVLLAANCCGYQGSNHSLLAAIIEFLHTATLLHDDVVDTSELRRGRSTANAVWGNAPSVLVGDFLYSRAFQMMVELGDMRIMSILAHSTNQISEGEVRQLANVRNAELTQQEYRDVIKAKTAILFEASSYTAAVLSQVDNRQEQALKDYGLHLGMTFQLIDDVLDYEGDAKKMGKNVGDDLAEGKVTLPLIYTMENSNETELKLIRDTITNGNSTAAEQEIIALVNACGAIDFAKEQAQLEAQQAVLQLETLPNNQYRDALENLVALAVNRNN